MDKNTQRRLEAVLKSAAKIDRPYFEHAEDIRNFCISYLMTHLAEHKPFVDRLKKMKTNYQLVVGNPLETIKSMMASDISLPEYQEEREKAIGYYNELSNLVEEYGLNPVWGMELVHEAVNDFHVLTSGLDDAEIAVSKKHTITWDTELPQSKREARSRVLEQFNKQWSEYEETQKAAGFYRARKRGALKDHVLWTFKKVCLHKTWNELASEENYPNPESLRKPVYQIIKLLGLRPTRRKGGRPHK